MILSLLATVAVLAAIAVIAAALVLAEPSLVYIALGLGGLSVLLLLGAIIQGRFSWGRSDTERTDGLGKSSVPVAAATAAGTVPAPPWEPEESGRVPAPAEEPVRESAVSEHPVPPGTPVSEPVSDARPASADESEEEAEFEVPRWQTPTMGSWPKPVVEPDEPAETAEATEAPEDTEAAAPVEAPGEAPAEEVAEEAAEAQTEAPVAEEAGEEAAEAPAEAFTYRIPVKTTREDPEDSEDPEETVSEDELQVGTPDEGAEPVEDDGGVQEALAEEAPAEEPAGVTEDLAEERTPEDTAFEDAPSEEEQAVEAASAEGEVPEDEAPAEEQAVEERSAEDGDDDSALDYAAIFDAEADSGPEAELSDQVAEVDEVRGEPEDTAPRDPDTQDDPAGPDGDEGSVEDHTKQPDSSYST